MGLIEAQSNLFELSKHLAWTQIKALGPCLTSPECLGERLSLLISQLLGEIGFLYITYTTARTYVYVI